MKQHITPEQLMELTNKQRKSLWEWWQPREGDKFYFDYRDETFIVLVNNNGTFLASGYREDFDFKKQDCLPLLSIGQMMELLIEKNFIGFYSNHIDFDWFDGSNTPEFADALWEAVKEVL